VRAAVLLLIAALCRAQDLANASLEQLMDIQVTSVSKKEQKLSRTAAAVFVITQDDIRRSGATNLPDVLMMAPGIQVARIDTTRWAITSRGFNGEYSNKMLVLVDGRSVYDPIFSGVHWDAQNMPLEDIERIEVIRGPGASVWGANAVNGVINVITRSASDTKGGLVSAGGGTDSDFFDTARYGGSVGFTDYRIYSRSFNRNPLPAETGPGSGPGWTMMNLGFRSDSKLRNGDTLTVQAEGDRDRYGETDQIVSTSPPYVTISNDSYSASSEYLLAKWKRADGQNGGMSLQAYFDGTNRSGPGIEEKNRIFDVEFQHERRLGPRQDLIWGAGLRSDNTTAEAAITSFQASDIDLILNAFVQNEIELKPDRLYLTLGGKLEHNSFSGFGFDPDVRLIWLASHRQSFWGSVSRALRTPALFERSGTNTSVVPAQDGSLVTAMFEGNPAIHPEIMWGNEIGYRVHPSKTVSLDWTAFYDRYSQLRSTENMPPAVTGNAYPGMQIQFGNGHKGETYGTEVAGSWNATSFWKWNMSYSWLRVKITDIPGRSYWAFEGDADPSPNHQFQVHSNLKLRRSIDFDTALYHVGPIDSQRLPGHDRLDARLGWQVRRGLEVSIVGQNLLGYRQIEFRSEGYTQAAESRRAFSGKMTWVF